MECYMEIKRTDRCVACHTDLDKEERGTPVRIQDESGFSIAPMCTSCLAKVTEYRKRKKEVLGV